MKIKLKKSLSIVLCLILVLFVLAGCGDKGPQKETSDPETIDVEEDDTQSEDPQHESSEQSGSDIETGAETKEDPETGEPDTEGSETSPETETETESESETKEAYNDKIESMLKEMTLEEKVAQLFIISPEALTGVGQVIMSGDTTRNAYNNYPVGGIGYSTQNMQSIDQIRNMVKGIAEISIERTGVPVFTFLDEEGGTVTRISGYVSGIPSIPNMASIGATGDPQQAYNIGDIIGGYLSDMGFTCDFAPVADVLTNPYNQVIGVRAFGSDPEVVSSMTQAFDEGLRAHHVYSVFKHFPGHGNTSADSHKGYAYTDKTLEELYECELIPFKNAIDDGISFIMMAHISLPNILSDDTPASLSYDIVTGLLREQLGFDGVVMTDALNMGAVTQYYSSKDACIAAIKAGCDMCLAPVSFQDAYYGVIDAVKDGTISEERIDESVRRILKVKFEILENNDSDNSGY